MPRLFAAPSLAEVEPCRRALLLSAAVCLYAAEWLCRWNDPNPEGLWYQFGDRPVPISFAQVYTPTSELRSHVFLTPNLRYSGPVPFERGDPKDQASVSTDEWGFFSDTKYADEVAKKKGPHEFRIIVVGGSGGQGHGASNLDATFERRLEKSLAVSLASRDDRWKVRVYNLAVGGQFADDNFYVLHQFGHALDPDLIVFYSGPNDLAHLTFWVLPKVMARQAKKTIDTEFAWEEKNISPGYVQALNRHFPYLGRKYQVFHKIDQTMHPHHYVRVKERLNIEFLKRWDISTNDGDNARASWPCWTTDASALPGKQAHALPTNSRHSDGSADIGLQVYQKVPLRSFVDSLQSVKRDFLGIPIVVAWQLINHQLMYDNWFDNDGIYDRFYEDSRMR